MSHDRRIVHSSEDPNWRTPKDLWYALDDHFQFLLDAAATEDDKLVAWEAWLGPNSRWGTNALAVDWKATVEACARHFDANFIGARRAIWLNPPYSKKKYRTSQDPAYLVESWARKCYGEARDGCTIVGLFPYTPQTEWYRTWVMGHAHASALGWDPDKGWTNWGWSGFAADSVWKLRRRISFIRADTNEKEGNAGVNHCIITWRPDPGYVGPWQPTERYWDWE